MGSGKTTTGRMLANVLKYCFFDSDAVLEQSAGGATVSEIFAANGEDGFREIEAAVLRELVSYKNCVIATGGGVVKRCVLFEWNRHASCLLKLHLNMTSKLFVRFRCHFYCLMETDVDDNFAAHHSPFKSFECTR
jgi:shikimate kinase